MVNGQAVVVDTQKVKHRGVEIVPRRAILDRLPAHFVRRTVGEPGLESGARHPKRKTRLIVVAAFPYLIGCRLRERCTPKLACEQNQRVIEHPALAQIAN